MGSSGDFWSPQLGAASAAYPSNRRGKTRSRRSGTRGPTPRLVEDEAYTWKAAGEALARGMDSGGSPIRLWARGTNFQIKVWEALLRVPSGRLVRYGDIARAVGKPGASRAVGQAVGANPVAVLIPCHRAIRASGPVRDGLSLGQRAQAGPDRLGGRPAGTGGGGRGGVTAQRPSTSAIP